MSLGVLTVPYTATAVYFLTRYGFGPYRNTAVLTYVKSLVGTVWQQLRPFYELYGKYRGQRVNAFILVRGSPHHHAMPSIEYLLY
jgi:hypothetical protein